MGWTKEQQQAIDLRGKNLLVSAAAGSGKTAVLVERIVKMVCEEDYDIDKILVVTFTKAAAAEMKERIGNRLLQEGIAHPDNSKIQEQLSYIHRAPISTIHSFCTNLLRNHFHMISLDPGFRIGEEGETALLKEQVLEELLEECYEQKEEEFLRFIEAYSYGKDDKAIGTMIHRLFEFSISHPMPEQWLTQALESLNIEEKEPDWLHGVAEYAGQILQCAKDNLERAIEIAKEDTVVAEKYVPFLMEEKAGIEEILDADSYDERQEAFARMEFKRSPGIRTKDPIVKEVHGRAKKIRDEVKDMVLHLEKDCYQSSLSQIRMEAEMLKPYMKVLINLVLRFSENYEKRKQEKNILEFHDLEHLALKLLISDYKDGEVVKTPLAVELSNRYQAIFTDEYQDSNLIQEVLLKAVSREEDGNRFMVGDIKQSIYKFRMARPEIFLEKYAQGNVSKMHTNIELCNNFRSRPEVLYAVNYIFYQIMKPSLGDVLYEKKAALTPPEEKVEDLKQRLAEGNETKQELLIVDLEKEEDLTGMLKDLSVIELEARMVAERIKKLSGYRCKDIVILLRTMEGWASVFEDVLTMEGIPVHTESRKGYFDTFEIRILLNVLSVVDNIYQDIPMAAVLRSPIGGLNGEDLAEIRSLVVGERRREDSLYDEMLFYLEKGKRDELKEKIRAVLELLEGLREEKTRLSLPELIWSFLDKTEYYHLVGSMPNGEQRMANIRMFLEKAGEYEKTSFKGVFHFIRYMEQIRTYDVDYGEAVILGEEADVVRIMSIHKSKGLEFPVVFLSGTGKMFNFMDRNQRMLLHPDYFIGLDCIDLKSRVKYASQQKKVISRQLTLSMLGEEIRVLYVAMTRARDKLIMTGVMDDFNKWFREAGQNPEAELSFAKMAKATCYLDWIFPAILRNFCMDAYRSSYGVAMNRQGYYEVDGESTHFQVKIVSAAELLGWEVEEKLKDCRKQADFYHFLKEEADTIQAERLKNAFAWEYPKKDELKSRSKWSVSQLKEENKQEPLLIPVEKFEEEKREKKEKAAVTGAERGTLIHKMMQEISFSEVAENGLRAAIDHMIENGRFPQEHRNVIPMKQTNALFTSDLGRRMLKAEADGALYKESQFMIGVPMREMEPDTDSEELVLVQGIIDLYLEEEDGLVLLDYKTDYVEQGQEQILIDRYRSQLKWYKRALEQMRGKKVKETYIYSFRLSKSLLVDKI